jgi:transcriptional/translational regulatory protein YebC/TACO1
VGLVEATHKEAKDIEEAAIEAGAQSVEPMDKADLGDAKVGAVFITDKADLGAVSNTLTAAGWNVTKSEFSFKPKNLVELTPEQLKEVSEFLQAIDDYDDTHRVYVGIK